MDTEICDQADIYEQVREAVRQVMLSPSTFCRRA
jgi:hypothetical protein